jgi:hypothetical protein
VPQPRSDDSTLLIMLFAESCVAAVTFDQLDEFEALTRETRSGGGVGGRQAERIGADRDRYRVAKSAAPPGPRLAIERRAASEISGSRVFVPRVSPLRARSSASVTAQGISSR